MCFLWFIAVFYPYCALVKDPSASSTSAAAQIVFDSVTAFFLRTVPGLMPSICSFNSRCSGRNSLFPEQMCKLEKKKDGRKMLN